MDREQIIKALECCGAYCHGQPCNECPYMHIELADNEICSNRMALDALALIKEITEENERLSTALAKYDRQTEVRIAEEYYTAEAYEELREENERLQKALNTDISIVRVGRGSGKTAHLREVGRIRADAIKSDTVREMQKRLGKHLCHDPAFLGVEQRLIMDVIDQIAKEMLEGL